MTQTAHFVCVLNWNGNAMCKTILAGCLFWNYMWNQRCWKFVYIQHAKWEAFTKILIAIKINFAQINKMFFVLLTYEYSARVKRSLDPMNTNGKVFKWSAYRYIHRLHRFFLVTRYPIKLKILCMVLAFF